MKKYWLYMIPFVLSCKTHSGLHNTIDVSGKYEQTDNKGFDLVLRKDSTFLYWLPNGKMGPEYGCCDTISYGKWSVDPNGMIALSSPEYFSNNLKINVKESKNEHKDTVYINIENPIENAISQHYTPSRSITYAVGALSKTTVLEPIKANDAIRNTIKIYNPKKEDIISISIVVYSTQEQEGVFLSADFNEGIRAARTDSYVLIDKESNSLFITMPELTESFLKLRRLKRDFVKIVNKSMLEWDGHPFQKK